jgi:Tat protein secretion system quality control protein TatD with DNase activity
VTLGVKTIRQFVITATLALAVAFSAPVFVHRRDYDAAFVKWLQSPTADNERALRLEARKNNRIALWSQLGAAGILFLLLNGVWFIAIQFDKRRSFHS